MMGEMSVDDTDIVDDDDDAFRPHHRRFSSAPEPAAVHWVQISRDYTNVYNRNGRWCSMLRRVRNCRFIIII